MLPQVVASSRRLLHAVCIRLRPSNIHQRVAYYYVRPKKRKETSTQAWLAFAGVTTTLIGTGVYLLGRPEESIEGLETEPDIYANVFIYPRSQAHFLFRTREERAWERENVIKAYLYRAWNRIKEFRRMFADPSSEKLLPDFLPPPYQRPYTIVLELNDVLLHSEYDRTVGWKYQKRPGLDALLMQLFDFYEFVVFTSESAFTANPLVAAMDPNQLILYHLYRDSTKYIKGHHVKDLTHLNRPLSKVIIIDTDPKSVQFHRENSIILDKWTGDIHDRTLWELIPFLQTIAANEVDDVRPVLDFYKSRGEKNILGTFKANQAKLREEEERMRAERERMTHRDTQQTIGGAIPTFSLRTFSRSSHTEMEQDSSPSPDIPFATINSLPQEDTSNSESSSWSMTKWIGSWIGWK